MMLSLSLAVAILDTDLSSADAVLARQYSDGSIGLTGQGEGDRIVPYFGNLACFALFDAAKRTNETKYLTAVERWIDWQISTSQKRIPQDHVVKDGQSKSINHVDAEDSYVSTLLIVINEWKKISKKSVTLQWLNAEQDCERVLQSLSDRATGLTFARTDYKVYFLMDQTETYQGLNAYSFLVNSKTYEANKILDSIEKLMWNEANRRYHWAMFSDQKFATTETKFYPVVMAQLMAIVRLPLSDRRTSLYKDLINDEFRLLDRNDPDQICWWLAAIKKMNDKARERELETALQTLIIKKPEAILCHHLGIPYLVSS